MLPVLPRAGAGGGEHVHLRPHGRRHGGLGLAPPAALCDLRAGQPPQGAAGAERGRGAASLLLLLLLLVGDVGRAMTGAGEHAVRVIHAPLTSDSYYLESLAISTLIDY